MGVAARIVEQLLASEVPLERGALEQAAGALLEEEAPLASAELVGRVVDLLVGLGPIETLMEDPAVSDVLVNADGSVWIERNGTLRIIDQAPLGPEMVRAAVERMITPLGLRLDRNRPAVDARLPDGSRLHAMVPPASVDGPVVAIRRFTASVADLGALADLGAADDAAVALLRSAVVERRSILVSGGTGAGKTTLLNVLGREVPPGQRIVTVEDAAELDLGGHVVRLETRTANSEGAGAITIGELIRHALRLRPDRIIVGEVRGGEAFDMLQAMSTGHAGSMSTVHATSPEEALWRVDTMAALGAPGLDPTMIVRQLRTAIDLVVQVERDLGGRRRLREITEVEPEGERSLWRR